MRYSIFFLFVLVCISSCKTDDDFIFEIPYRSLVFTVPPGVSVLNYHQFSIPLDAKQVLDAVGGGNSYEEIVPMAALLQSLDFEQDLSFAADISVTICNANDGDPNCGREIFWKNPTSFSESTPSNLWANDNDISEYLESGDVVIKIKFSQLRTTTFQELNLVLDLDFVAR